VWKYRAFIIIPKYGTSILAAMLLLSRKASSTSPPIISAIYRRRRFHWCLIGQLAMRNVKKLETNQISHVKTKIVNALTPQIGRDTAACASKVTKGTHTSMGVAKVRTTYKSIKAILTIVHVC
jgi:hypothetical protein